MRDSCLGEGQQFVLRGRAVVCVKGEGSGLC